MEEFRIRQAGSLGVKHPDTFGALGSLEMKNEDDVSMMFQEAPGS